MEELSEATSLPCKPSPQISPISGPAACETFVCGTACRGFGLKPRSVRMLQWGYCRPPSPSAIAMQSIGVSRNGVQVDQNGASWNRIEAWLTSLNRLQKAA